MPACRYVEEISPVAIVATKRLAGVIPEVNLKECETHMPLPSPNKTVHSGLKPRENATRRLKQGHVWLHKKYLCPPKIHKN